MAVSPKKDPKPARGTKHQGEVPPGDDVGAAELARRVAQRMKAERAARNLSLDDVARASGVSRAALSQIETLKSNPSIGVLWKIAVGLGLTFADLLDEQRSEGAVLRRGDTQVLKSPDGRFESRPLSPAGVTPFVEVYELRMAARARYAAEAHAPGTREILVVLSGMLRVTAGATVFDLEPGDSIAFVADQPHVYENPGNSEARYHNVIVYGRT
jgi:XRE family transcriptional regulator, regulator of sulfur utilization